jgi:hypothetical protein
MAGNTLPAAELVSGIVFGLLKRLNETKGKSDAVARDT